MRVTTSTWTTSVLSLCLVCTVANADDETKIDLKVGDTAPAFEARDDGDKSWTSTDYVGKQIIVIYFYPADFTPGCMAQALQFRDRMNALAEKGVRVIGISGDSVSNHDLFKKEFK